MQVFVCGMHRSGTSMVARLLNLMGMYFGPEGSGLPVNRENPKGFWERRDVVELNDRLLAATDSVWYDVYGFLMRGAGWRPPRTLVDELRAKLLDIDAYRPWFIKDPRLCLTLPYWLELCERPVVVVCSRSPQAVIASLAKRTEITGLDFTVDEAMALWEAYNVGLLRNVHNVSCVFVRYEDMLDAPERACIELVAELERIGLKGLRMPHAADIAAFVDAQLQRSSAIAQVPPSEHAVRVDALLRNVGGGTGEPKMSGASMVSLRGLHERLAQTAQQHRLLAALYVKRGDLEATIARNVSEHDEPAWSVERLHRLARRLTKG